MVSGMMILKCPETEEHKVEEKRKYKGINTWKVGNKRKQTKIPEKEVGENGNIFVWPGKRREKTACCSMPVFSGQNEGSEPGAGCGPDRMRGSFACFFAAHTI